MKMSKIVFALVCIVFGLAIYADTHAQSNGSGGITPYCTVYSVTHGVRTDVPLGVVYRIKSESNRSGATEFTFAYGNGNSLEVTVREPWTTRVWEEINRCFGGPVKPETK